MSTHDRRDRADEFVFYTRGDWTTISGACRHGEYIRSDETLEVVR